jgi:LPXTG-motif cell wall-anchored protein
MNKQLSTRGLTGLSRIRAVLAFRHKNPIARFVSTLVAFAIATLLVVGTGAAYAGDADPSTTTDATTTDSSTAGATTADGSTTSSGTSSTDPTSTGPTSTGPTSTDPASTSTTTSTTTGTKSVTKTTSSLSPLSLVPFQALATPITNTGGFEIDGDTIVGNNGGDDWTNADKVTESYRDAAGYQGTNKMANDPSTWSGAQVATEKMDMVNLWVKTLLDGPRGAFGIQRDAANGTTAYYFEYNHKPNLPGDVAKPDRSPNDVMFGFTQSGNNTGNKLSFDQGYVYALMSSSTWNAPGTTCTQINGSNPAGGWCTLNTGNGVFYGATSDGSGGGAAGTYDTGIFAEGIVDFSKLTFPPGSCLGALGHLNVRSQSSLEWTSAMQDFATAAVDVPPTCGSLTVLKKGLTGDALIPGAIYSIIDDPRPGQTGTYTVFDGTQDQLDAINLSADPAPAGTVADGDANGKIEVASAEPGTYKVTELRAPDGYLLPATVVQDNIVVGGPNDSVAARNPEVTFRDPKAFAPLTAMKTAHGDYDASYAWTITKGVRSGSDDFASSASKDSANATESFDWLVSIGEGARTESNHVVSGAITISNPNDSSVLATVTEGLSGCVIYDPADTTPPLTALADASGAAGFQVSVPANDADAGTPYQYTCAQPNKNAASNTATVTVVRGDYPRGQDDVGMSDSYAAEATAGGSLTADISWTEHNPDGTKTITVTDVLQGTSTTHAGSGAPWSHTWGIHADPAWNGTTSRYEHQYASGVTAAGGSCASVTNTATITQTGQSAEATASHCRGLDLTVSKNAAESLTRTYLWDITKSSTDEGAQYVDPDTGTATTHWDVTVSATGTADEGWQMSGTISVTNPNSWGVELTGLADSYTGGSGCAVDNWATLSDAQKTVPANDSKDFTYTCTFKSKPAYDGTNTATATWDAATAATPTGTDDFDLPIHAGDWTLDAEHNKQVTVIDGVIGHGSPGAIGDTYTWAPGLSETIHYTADLGAPAGQCQTWTNVATLHGDGGNPVGDPASDTVDVCNAQQLAVSKTADGHFVRTYHWDLHKFVSADAGSDPADRTATSDSWSGPSFSHPFGYRVELSQLPATDDSFTITGTITLSNPNQDLSIPAISSTITDTPDVGAAGDCVIDDSANPDDGAQLLGYHTPAIASGDHLDIGYLCTVDSVTSAEYTGTDNVVTATNASNSPATAGVTFTKDGEIDKTVTVYDDKVDLSTPEALGTVTYDESVPDKTYDWDYTLEHTATAVECQDFTNHVSVFSDDSLFLDLAAALAPLDTAEATATVCPQPGTWVVSKTSNVGDGTVPVGSDITYTLTAHKTGGVNPTNVALTDDLSALAPYVDFPAFSAPAGQSVAFSGNVLTWTIDELGAADATLSFTVHVRSTSFSVDLPNMVTSVGSSNCPDKASATRHDECTTDNGTPAAPVIVVSPPKPTQKPHPHVLPNTGGPNGWIAAGGLALVLAGGTLVLADQRRRRRS